MTGKFVRFFKEKPYLPICLIGFCFLFICVMALGLYRGKKGADTLAQNHYQQSFYTYGDAVGKIETYLNKARVSKVPQQNTDLFAELKVYTTVAKENLLKLPYAFEDTYIAAQTLSSIHDFSSEMIFKIMDNTPYTDEDYERLQALYQRSAGLSREFELLMSQSESGQDIEWLRMDNGGRMDNPALTGSAAQLKKEWQDGMIQPGKNAEANADESLFLKDKAIITGEQGAAMLSERFSWELSQIRLEAENSEAAGNIPVHRYSLLDEKGKVLYEAEISKQGGYMVWMLATGMPQGNKGYLTNLELLTKARNFINISGFQQLNSRFYSIYEDTITFQFVPSQEHILLYPDMVQVKLCRHTGSLLGVEANSFLMNFREREIPEAIISLEEARSLLANELFIYHSQQVVFQTSQDTEALCYEFYGILNGDHFLIFMNAVTGKQEEVIPLHLDENGVIQVT